MFEINRAVITELKRRFIVTSAPLIYHTSTLLQNTFQLRKLTNASCFQHTWNISQTL
jgi:hypothetical protein